ncbi:MAG TPA: hypothetical protein VKA44_01190, partial [Gemmatimonadota bacterium]|nr:hypothetical protein [Gemmatimonadota bacterium]
MASLLRVRASVPAIGRAAALGVVLAALVGPAPAAAQLSTHALALAGPDAEGSTPTLKATPGDGIWDLLQRAGVTPTPSAIRAFKARNRSRLLHGDQLMVGRSYRVPGGSRVG